MTATAPTTVRPPGRGTVDEIAVRLEPSLRDMGFDLVRITLAGQARRTLQVMVERSDRATITVEDCATVSHSVSAILDVEEPIPGAYDLEVSSPGLDRPLIKLDDYQRFCGFTARIEMTEPVEGQRRFKGTLQEGADGPGPPTIVILTEAGERRLPLESVRKAKLVLDDRLLAAAKRWASDGRSP
ncbi:MAG: ribosome maturation factor RimP [Pseudomonadota bacterium]